MPNIKLASLLLRVGIAFTFLYAAISGFIIPDAWVGFLPPFMTNIIPGATLLAMFGIYEIVLGLWLLSGWRIFYPALLSAATMAGIIFSDFSVFLITFRDVSILTASLALAVLHKERD
ncbi:MAG: hypothetical protein AAB345_04830 [Patescibacteria group bacterium]